MHIMCDSLTSLNRRTVAEIREKITEKGRRNPLSRLVHAKNDKETIGAWRSDLNGFLHVFNVCSADFAWSSLIIPFQTELAVNTNLAVSDIRHDVSKIREEISGQARSVSATSYSSTECSPSPRLNPGQLSRISCGPQSYCFTAPLLENYLPRHRGPVSDVTS